MPPMIEELLGETTVSFLPGTNFLEEDYFLLEAIPNLFSDRKKYKEEIHKLIEESKEISSEAIAYASLAMKSRKAFTALLNDREYLILHGALVNLVQIE